MKRPQYQGALIAVGLAFLAACDTGLPTDTSQAFSPFAAILSSNNTVEPQHFKVCKVGTSADFTFTINQGASTGFSLAAGECLSIHQNGGWPPDTVTVTETAQAGVQLDSIVLGHYLGGGPVLVTSTTLTGTSTASGRIEFEEGYVATFYNRVIETPGGEGCTPGYWKNHLSNWPVSPNLDFDATFGVSLFSPNITLGTAITLGGGGVNKLARHGTAAYLNSFAVNSPYTTAQVIAYVQAGNADVLAAANELGCPLNR